MSLVLEIHTYDCLLRPFGTTELSNVFRHTQSQIKIYLHLIRHAQVSIEFTSIIIINITCYLYLYAFASPTQKPLLNN